MRKFKIIITVLSFAIFLNTLYAQELTTVKLNEVSSVKNQGMSGTCWCFSVVSILESGLMKAGINTPDLSEMYIVRNIYSDKAKNYILRQGFTRFTEGAFGHDVFPAVTKYGIVPEEVYPYKQSAGVDVLLKKFLDSVLLKQPISPDWENNYNRILDENFGKLPSDFTFQGKKYTPQEFANEVLKFNADDYIGLTSYTHHPFYKPFNVEVPDNYSGGLFYNVPIDELIGETEYAIMNGFTVGWDADVSNPFFGQQQGFALVPEGKTNLKGAFTPDDAEVEYTQKSRQDLFENLTTQDDHLMHLVGIKKTDNGKKFFYVKNSWGNIGPLKGFINVSETYFGINTITIVLPKAALSSDLRTKLGI
jgi:bleomycin hydrolase